MLLINGHPNACPHHHTTIRLFVSNRRDAGEAPKSRGLQQDGDL
jgi:hypothetical protein